MLPLRFVKSNVALLSKSLHKAAKSSESVVDGPVKCETHSIKKDLNSKASK